MPNQDLPLLIDAAREASEIARSHWPKAQAGHVKKSDGSPVSDGDYAVDEFLRETLIAARPEYGWLSEETEDDSARLASARQFIVDPIDGTRSYVDGGKTWAHSIAVVENGQPTAGVVYLPERDKMYAAALGEGATLNGNPIRVGRNDDPDRASLLASRSSLSPQHWSRGHPRGERHFRPSLAYRFCLVAEGRFDASLTLKDAWEWDIAAGAIVATEAGAVATDRHGRPLRLNAATPCASGLIVANPALHAALRARLDP